MVRLNEISEDLDFCSACKIGYLKLTGEVVVKQFWNMAYSSIDWGGYDGLLKHAKLIYYQIIAWLKLRWSSSDNKEQIRR